MPVSWVDNNSKINDMEITDEYFMVDTGTRGKVVSQKLQQLREGGVVLVSDRKNKDKVIGYITKKEIIDSVAEGRNPIRRPAEEFMVTDFMEVVEDERLGDIIPLIAERYPDAIVVIDWESRFVGFFSKNDYKDALAAMGVYDKSHDPETPDEWLTKGIAMSSMGQLKDALKCYENFLKLYREPERGWFELARKFEVTARYKDAIMCYERVNAINPTNEDAWLNRGNVHSIMRNSKRALQCYKKAQNIKPNDVKILTNMGLAYSDLGHLGNAISCFDKADTLHGETADIWYNKGNAYDKAEQEKKAIKCYDKAIKLNPDHEDAWFNKGASLHVLSKEKRAIKCFEEVLRINPNNQGAREALNVCKEDKGVGLF